jgi:hypothetical protein
MPRPGYACALTLHQDIFNIGRVLHLKGFLEENDVEYIEMRRELNRTATKDRRRRLEDGTSAAESIVRGVVLGRVDDVDVESEYTDIMFKWLTQIRARFAGRVIRRTGNSLDYEGKLISGIAPPSEHMILLNLKDWEASNLEELVDAMAAKPAGGSRMGGNEVRDQYLFLFLSIYDCRKWCINQPASTVAVQDACLTWAPRCPVAWVSLWTVAIHRHPGRPPILRLAADGLLISSSHLYLRCCTCLTLMAGIAHRARSSWTTTSFHMLDPIYPLDLFCI